jgi:hypothetical protein
MRSFSQHWMLAEMIVIFIPITFILMVSAPFVAMISLSKPMQIANFLLGIMYCVSCAALYSAWVLALRFWRHGADGLRMGSKHYTVLVGLGAVIAVISCGMALFEQATGFLMGVPMLIPYSHLMYELRVSNTV